MNLTSSAPCKLPLSTALRPAVIGSLIDYMLLLIVEVHLLRISVKAECKLQ